VCTSTSSMPLNTSRIGEAVQKRCNIDMFKAIIFDLFHTLTSAKVVGLQGKGTSATLGVSRDAWNEQLWYHSEDRLRGRIKDGYEIIKKMAHAIDSQIPLEVIRQATMIRIERFRYALTHIEPGVLETITLIRAMGKKTGLVSNGDANEFLGWNDSPLKGLFDSVVFSSDVGYVKPEPQIYRLCCEQLSVRPQECLYVGDGGNDELCGAQACGMTTVLTTRVIRILWPEKVLERRRCADHEISELHELLSE
jgi:putative hydrolase of the HAD superfamily